MNDAIHIDGSQGEGGGQIVRSSLALALVTGRPVTIDNIRAGREKPGLLRQHLTAVNAAVEICGGSATGNVVASPSLSFEPRPVRPGEYKFSVGTAGSATLVLQTVLPTLLTADGPTTLILEGGTHNPWAPPFDFLEKAFLPFINRMGPRVDVEIERHGFFPAGGGRFRVHVQPAQALCGFDLCERGEPVNQRVRILLSRLPGHIGEREARTIIRKLNWDAACCAVEEVDSPGPGNAILVEVGSDHVTEVFSGFGRQGVKAEDAAADVVQEVRAYLTAGVPVGEHLADQLMLPLGISAWQQDPQSPGIAGKGPVRQRGGAYRTLPLSRHSTTHIDLLRQILGVSIDVERADDDQSCIVRIGP
ncbi:MAG TPA: RNA 3'-terminal phosphate cyclase [Planctomycetaceae bacterium]|jgi:RNA 3'-terminal phosphate cyclase (ATP)